MTKHITKIKPYRVFKKDGLHYVVRVSRVSHARAKLATKKGARLFYHNNTFDVRGSIQLAVARATLIWFPDMVGGDRVYLAIDPRTHTHGMISWMDNSCTGVARGPGFTQMFNLI